MIGPMSDAITASARMTMARRKPLDTGTCIYYRETSCRCDRIPRCPHWFACVCLARGHCGDLSTRYYVAPPEIRCALPVEVDA